MRQEVIMYSLFGVAIADCMFPELATVYIISFMQ